MNMKGGMDVLNTLFHMSILFQNSEEACYYAALALKQASGKDRNLLPHQESDFPKVHSQCSLEYIYSIFLYLT